MAGTQIPSTPADGRMKTILVPQLANPSAPTIAELKMGTDISCYIELGGFNFNPTQATISDQRECSDQDYQRPGRKSVGDASITVIDNTNSEFAAEYNKAVEAMAEGTSCYIVRRRGLPAGDDFKVGHTVTVIPVVFGEKQPVVAGENTTTHSTIPFYVTGEWYSEKATVAA